MQTAIDVVEVLLVLAAILGGIYVYVVVLSKPEQVKMLLCCKMVEAKKIYQKMTDSGMSFMTLHRLVHVGLGRFMPVYATPGQFVATWQEVYDAVTALMLRTTISPSISDQRFIEIVGKEILQRRGTMGEADRWKLGGLLDTPQNPHPEDEIKF